MPFVQTRNNRGYPPHLTRKQVTTLPNRQSMSGK